MDDISTLIINTVRADSIGSIVIRALIWFVLVSIFAYGTAKGKEISRIKAEAGFFLLFIFLAGASIYLMFGIIPTLTTPPEAFIFTIGLLASHITHGLYRLNKTSFYSP